MNKNDAIKALKIGVEQALDIIDYYRKRAPAEDPAVQHAVDQLKTLLVYSNHVQDDPQELKHDLYDN